MASAPRHPNAIHGSNPQVSLLLPPHPRLPGRADGTQFLIEKVIRARIYDSLYWKEHCFALTGQFRLSSLCRLESAHWTAESIIDKAIACNAIGGVYDRQTPTQFMCLTLKLLQLQPEKEILFEYLLAEEFKWVQPTAVPLGATVIRG